MFNELVIDLIVKQVLPQFKPDERDGKFFQFLHDHTPD